LGKWLPGGKSTTKKPAKAARTPVRRAAPSVPTPWKRKRSQLEDDPIADDDLDGDNDLDALLEEDSEEEVDSETQIPSRGGHERRPGRPSAAPRSRKPTTARGRRAGVAARADERDVHRDMLGCGQGRGRGRRLDEDDDADDALGSDFDKHGDAASRPRSRQQGHPGRSCEGFTPSARAKKVGSGIQPAAGGKKELEVAKKREPKSVGAGPRTLRKLPIAHLSDVVAEEVAESPNDSEEDGKSEKNGYDGIETLQWYDVFTDLATALLGSAFKEDDYDSFRVVNDRATFVAALEDITENVKKTDVDRLVKDCKLKVTGTKFKKLEAIAFWMTGK
jgi:hypothetical protein